MDYVQQMLAVGVVLLLLGGLLWWLRRRGFTAPGRARGRRRMEVLERLPLGPQHSLHLVRWEGSALLVACSPAGCTLLESPAGRRETETAEACR